MSAPVRIPASDFSQFVFVSLGSNLGDSRQILLQALGRLQGFSIQPLLKSSLWESTPVDCPPGSGKFINAVAGWMPRVGETPESLLEKLQDIEKDFGRRPKLVLNEARPLDLDLIVFGQETRRTWGLSLPHPRAHLRRFVLQPLSELAPDYVLPGQGSTVAELLAALVSDEVITRL